MSGLVTAALRGRRCRAHAQDAILVLLAIFAWLMVATARAELAIGTLLGDGTDKTSGPLSLRIVVTSDQEVASVVATIDDTLLGALRYESDSWVRQFDIRFLARGSHTLTIAATDIIGNRASRSQTFFYNAPPEILIESPAKGAAAAPRIRISATCTDDDSTAGCLYFNASVEGSVATGVSKIDADIDVGGPGLNGSNRTARVVFAAVDSDGTWVQAYVYIFVVGASASLVPLEQVPGGIWDVAPDRILYQRGDGSVVIRNRSDASDSVLGMATVPADPAQLSNPSAWGTLTSSGASWTSVSNCTATFYEHRQGQTASVYSFGCHEPRPIVSGDFAYWPNVLRNLTSGVEQSNPCKAFAAPTPLLGANGAFFCLVGGPSGVQVHKLVGDSLMLMAELQGIMDPETDGRSIAHFAPRPGGYLPALLNEAGQELLLSDRVQSSRSGGMAIADGWTAYTRADASNTISIWRRSPGGLEEPVATVSNLGWVQQAVGDGRVVFQDKGRDYYVAVPGSPPVYIWSRTTDFYDGTIKPLAGQLHAWLGGTLLRVEDGLIDAGGPARDAAVEAGAGLSDATLSAPDEVSAHDASVLDEAERDAEARSDSMAHDGGALMSADDGIFPSDASASKDPDPGLSSMDSGNANSPEPDSGPDDDEAEEPAALPPSDDAGAAPANGEPSTSARNGKSCQLAAPGAAPTAKPQVLMLVLAILGLALRSSRAWRVRSAFARLLVRGCRQRRRRAPTQRNQRGPSGHRVARPHVEGDCVCRGSDLLYRRIPDCGRSKWANNR